MKLPERGRGDLLRGERALRIVDVNGVGATAIEVGAEGDVVLTERTDALVIGPVVWQFWVYGRFEIVDGRIAVWRDSFDYADVTVGLVRGLLGVKWPALGRRWPSD